MRPTISQYAQSLEELSREKTGEDFSVLVHNFLALLKRRGESKKIPAIIEHFEKMQNDREGKIGVRAILAHEADEETKAKIMTEAQHLFPGKDITLEYSIDADIIGGVRFRTDELLYDATLSHAVTHLKQSFLKA